MVNSGFTETSVSVQHCCLP